jgi:gamma-glutamylcyclotransferase (GGCT)/AIG2-like uncharacterized protein YtfP
MYLFVYGTLLRSLENPRRRILETCAEFYNLAILKGKLYTASASYPGARSCKDCDYRVYGEVYVSEKETTIFKSLDRFEGYSRDDQAGSLFIRKKKPVTLPDGSVLNSWAYLYNRSVREEAAIQSGDYLKHLSKGSLSASYQRLKMDF